MSKDYYNILGVSKNANEAEIKKAFREKAHKFHPDKADGDEAKFKEVSEAYRVLSDKNKRAQYDQFGTAFNGAGPQGQGGFNGGFGGGGYQTGGFNINMDDLGDIFGGFGDIFGGGRRSKRSKRGRDLHLELKIDFMDAVFGMERDIPLKKNMECEKCSGSGAEPGHSVDVCKNCNGTGVVTSVQQTFLGNIQTETTCPDCQGEGKIPSKKCSACNGRGVKLDATNIKLKIPAGIDNGETIRLSGYGEAGEKGSLSGDLYVTVNVVPDKRFVRQDYDVKSVYNLSVKQAILGDKVEIDTVDGPVKLKIPEGTQPGTIFRLRDHGIPKLRGTGRGSHMVEVKVLIPKGLSRKNKKALEELDI